MPFANRISPPCAPPAQSSMPCTYISELPCRVSHRSSRLLRISALCWAPSQYVEKNVSCTHDPSSPASIRAKWPPYVAPPHRHLFSRSTRFIHHQARSPPRPRPTQNPPPQPASHNSPNQHTQPTLPISRVPRLSPYVPPPSYPIPAAGSQVP